MGLVSQRCQGVFVGFCLSVTWVACSSPQPQTSQPRPASPAPVGVDPVSPQPLEPSSGKDPLRHLVILGTNDIHGGVDPTIFQGRKAGGMAQFGGIVRAIRKGIERKYGEYGAVLLADAGDQFQGTLVSNYGEVPPGSTDTRGNIEGSLVFKTMDMVGYDAVIPGNHDYDFGPVGWLNDTVEPGKTGSNRREVIENLAKRARFPLLSANTYFKDSIVDATGTRIEVDGSGCRPTFSSGRGLPRPEIEWSRAKRPEFLKPWQIVPAAKDVRVAFIGIDNPGTPTSTTPENVSDLCFRDEFETVREIRKELEGKADVFVLVIHNGDSSSESTLTKLLQRLSGLPHHGVDVVIAGHTHFDNHLKIGGIVAVQSGSGGDRFGRVELVYDTETKAVRAAETRSYSSIRMEHEGCAPKTADFCEVSKDAAGLATVRYDGEIVARDEAIQAEIDQAHLRVDDLAKKRLGEAVASLKKDRIAESSLANMLTDGLRQAAQVDIAFMNTGGIRVDIPAGPVTYEQLFQVLPFNNNGWVIGPMGWETVRALLKRSIETCGAFGSLMQSGLRVRYSRECPKKDEFEPKFALLHVETLSGEVLFDAETGREAPPNRSFTVATLDFLAKGGSGYSDFIGAPFVRSLGIVREVLKDEFLRAPVQWTGKLDGRWQNISGQ